MASVVTSRRVRSQREALTDATGNRFNFCEELASGAERELAAFAAAVTQRFGTVQARYSIEDWMQELRLIEWLTGQELPEWRQVTVRAAARLGSPVPLASGTPL